MPIDLSQVKWDNADPAAPIDVNAVQWDHTPAPAPGEYAMGSDVPMLTAGGTLAPAPNSADVRALQGRLAGQTPGQMPVLGGSADATANFNDKFGNGAAQYFAPQSAQPIPIDPGAPEYGQGAGYLIDNPLTRGLGQGGNALLAGTGYLAGKAISAVSPAAGERFNQNELQPTLARDAQLAPPNSAGLLAQGVQLTGNIGGQLAGAMATGGGGLTADAANVLARGGLMDATKFAATSPSLRIAGSLGTAQAGHESAMMDAEGHPVSLEKFATMALTNTAANLVPVAGPWKLPVRVASGAAVGVGANEATNFAAGRPVGTGDIPAAALGAAFGLLPGHGAEAATVRRAIAADPIGAGAAAADGAIAEAKQAAPKMAPFDFKNTGKSATETASDPLLADVQPAAPELPTVPEGASRADLIQQYKAAQTDNQRTAAAAQIAAFDAKPADVAPDVTPPAADAFAEIQREVAANDKTSDAITSEIGDQGSAQFERTDPVTGSKIKALVGPDMSKPGTFRVTRFDGSGPFAHAEFPTMRDAVDDAVSNGYKRVEQPVIPDYPDLNPDQRAVESRARQQVLSDPAAAVAAYKALPGTDNGRIISTDHAREVFTDYNAGPDARSANAVAVHEPASYISKQAYQQALAKPPSGDNAYVLFAAGGTGAGKTTGMVRVPDLADWKHNADVVYDGNLQSTDSAVGKIDQALATDRKVRVAYTLRDPVQAFFHGAIPRAERADYGRTVPINAHTGTHIGSAQTYLALRQHYEGNPNVEFRAIANDYVPGERSEVTPATDAQIHGAANVDRAKLNAEIEHDLEQQHEAGNISDRVYHGTLGKTVLARGAALADGRGNDASGTGPGDGDAAGQSGRDASGGIEPALGTPDQVTQQIPPDGGISGSETPTSNKAAGNPIHELPLADLSLSEDVPQFKGGANEAGVVEPLGGKFDRRGTGPIQVWRRNNGNLEVISGRHRLDLARRSGEKTIPAQVYNEADGFDAQQAASLDAELNIRDGNGTVKDYVQYFKRPGFDGPEGQQAAESRGLLARSTGKRAFTIARQGSDDLAAAHSAGRVSDEAAVQIAQAAPNNAPLQALGMKQVQEGKSITNATNTMRAVATMAPSQSSGDMFGFNDSAIQDAGKIGAAASKHQRDIGERLAAITGASKRPELARKEGVNVHDPESMPKRIAQLRAEKDSWDNFATDPAKMSQLRQELGMERPDEAPTTEAPAVDDATAPMFSRDELAQPDAKFIESARKFFGVTHDTREAGYVLPDGSMLDFTGRHYSDNHPSLRGQRSVDHRELTGENSNGYSMDDMFRAKSGSGNDHMQEFMGRTHAMRVDFRSGVASVMGDPTPAQVSVLSRGIRGDYAALSVIDPVSGRIIDDAEIDNPTPQKIQRFFASAKGKTAPPNAPLFSRRDTETSDMFGASPPKPREVSARPQSGDMFGGPKTSDFVGAAERTKDAQRNGLAGGKADTGDGGLFDGKRPEQTSIPARTSRIQLDTPVKAKFTGDQVRAQATKAWGSRIVTKLERGGILHFITTDEAIAAKLGTAADLRGVKGMYFKGKAYVLTDHIGSLDDVAGTVLHEIGVHYGLGKILSSADRSELYGLMDEALAKGDPDIMRARAHAEKVGTPMSRINEETLAYLAEHKPGHGIIRRLIDAIIRGLNRLGIPLRMLESQVATIRRMAREMLRRAGEKATDRTTFDGKAAQGWKMATVNGKRMFSYVWHGTPHTVDKFSLQHIGTGEGAQAYGWGMYFAGIKEIAAHYREVLAQEGKNWNPSAEATKLGLGKFEDYRAPFHQLAMDRDIPTVEAAKKLRNMSAAARSEVPADVEKLFRAYRDSTEGNLYRAEIPDDNNLLDYDKPLSEQPESVRAAVKKVLASHGLTGFNSTTGREAYEMLSKHFDSDAVSRKDFYFNGGDAKAASEALNAAGIPGLRYLDGSSRTSGDWHISSPSETVAGDWMVKNGDYNSKGLHFATKAEAEAALKEKPTISQHNYVIWDEGAIGAPERMDSKDVAPDESKSSRDLLGDDDTHAGKVRREAAITQATTKNQLAAEGYPQGAIGWTGKPNEYTTWRRTVENLMDRYVPIKRIQRAITGGKTDDLADDENVYRLENLMHGRAGDAMDTLDRTEVKPLVKSMKQLHVAPELLSDYLMARHAPERNERVAEVNPALPDGGSGMTTQQAKDFMDGNAPGVYSGKKITPENRKALESLATRVDRITHNTVNTLEASGQITPQLAGQLRKAYQFYVPLRGKVSDIEATPEPASGGFGGGVNVKGSPVKRALGRGEGNLAGRNILGEVIGDAQRAIIQGEKARVGRAVLKLASAHPNPDVWQVEPVDLEWKFSEATGEAYLGTRKPSNDQDVMTTVVNGKAYHVRLVDKELQRSILNMDSKSAELMVSVIGKMNRWLSAAFTRYNPAFVPINVTRDIILATVGMTAEHGAKQTATMLKYYLPAMRAAWRDTRAVRPGSSPEAAEASSMDAMAREFAENGGRTGIALSETPEEITKSLANSVKSGMQIMRETKLDPKTWGKPAQAAGKALGHLQPIVHWIERVNDATENATRLAAYTARRKGGASPEAAAAYAKDITVNFNRKGHYGSVLNSLFLFYNASIQGASRVVKLTREHPKGISAFLGSVAALQASMAVSLMARKNDDGISDWDAIPDWKKSTALIIPLPGAGNYFALPMPYEFGFISYAGGRIAEQFMEHDSSKVNHNIVSDLGKAFLHSMSPIPLEQGLTGLVPAPLQAFNDIRANKDDLGREITFGEDPNGFDKPQSSLGRPGVPEPYIWLSRTLNKVGGGNPDWRPPIIAPSVTDVSPDALMYLTDFFTGGIGSFMSGSWRSAQAVSAGIYKDQKDGSVSIDKMKLARDLPILSRFGFSTNVNRARSNRFYDIRDEMNRVRAMIQSKVDRSDMEGAREVAKKAGIFGDGWTIKVNRNGAPATSVHKVDGRPARTLTLEAVPGTMAAAYQEAEFGINVRHRGQSFLVQPGVRDYNRAIHADMGMDGTQRVRSVKSLQDQRGELMGAFLKAYERRDAQLKGASAGQ